MREKIRAVVVETIIKQKRIKVLERALIFLLLLNFVTACNPANRVDDSSSGNLGNSIPSGTSSQVALVWNANLGEQQGFYIEQSTDGINFTQILTVPDGTNTATVTVSGSVTYFRIRGYNQAGTSPYTAVVAQTMDAANQ